MFNFSELLKTIRQERNFTQQELAEALGVSKVLIGMIESGMKPPSKKFITLLSEKLKIHSAILMPYLSSESFGETEELSSLEKKLINIGKTLQNQLIKKHAKYLGDNNA